MKALLLLAFGGPLSLGEVEIFLTRLFNGRKPSPEQLERVKERYRLIGRSMGLDLLDRNPGRSMSSILEELNRLRMAAGVGKRLGQLGVHRTSIPELARKAMDDPCMVTNPCRPARRDIEAIYEAAL